MSEHPFVSVIIPCRNEERFIEDCLRSIVANDYPHDAMEILVVDGMSEDRTRVILRVWNKQYPFIRLLDNPKKITPSALNIGIRAAQGTIVIRMDAHAHYEPNYIRICVENLDKYQADNVGGIFATRPCVDTLMARSIAKVLSHRFGVGNSSFRTYPRKVQEVDTVAFGCYRKEIFDKVGFFDERLRRSQDMEFNLRLKRAGGKIVLIPEIIAYYYPPGTAKNFIAHTFHNGEWATLPRKFTGRWLSLRHYAPLFFLGGLFLATLLTLLAHQFWYIVLGVLALYCAVALVVSIGIAARTRQWQYAVSMPLLFVIFHFIYGVGSIFGLIKLALPPYGLPRS